MSAPKKKILKWVDLLTFDGQERISRVVARCVLEDGVLRFEGSSEIVKNLKREQIYLYETQTVLTPSDGEDFLDHLSRLFNSPYLFADEIKEAEALPPLSEENELKTNEFKPR